MKILVVLLILMGLPISGSAETVFWRSETSENIGGGLVTKFNIKLSIEEDSLYVRLDMRYKEFGLYTFYHKEKRVRFSGIEQSRHRLIAAFKQILEWHNTAHAASDAFIRTATLDGPVNDLVFTYKSHGGMDLRRYLEITIAEETVSVFNHEGDRGDKDKIETLLKDMIRALEDSISNAMKKEIEKQKQNDDAMRGLGDSKSF